MSLSPYPRETALVAREGAVSPGWESWLNALRALVNAQGDQIAALQSQVSALDSDLATLVTADHNPDGTHKFEWVDVAYPQMQFSGYSLMTWTVSSSDVYANRYRRIAASASPASSTMEWSLDVQTSTVGGTPNVFLTASIPDGYVPVSRMGGPCVISDNGTQACGWWIVLPGVPVVRFYRHPQAASNWAASTNNTSVVAHMVFEVTP